MNSTPVSAAARRVAEIHRPPRPHWVGDGFRVAGYFSHIPDAERRLDPFLLLDYAAPHVFPPTGNLRRGVGPHPHRGFETVTLAFQGSVAHHDSTGRGGVIRPGDVQWMTAASGILHREYHEESFAKSGGTMQMAQIWVNLPRAHKMDAPGYQAITGDRMGIVSLPGGAGTVRVVAGEYLGVEGPAKTYTPIGMFDATLAPGGRAEFAIPARHNAAMLVMDGSARIQGEDAAAEDFVLFENAGESIAVESKAGARLLVLSGEPIGEPIASYGPFVMNTPEEIEQAILDFNTGKFGRLDD